MVHEHPLEAPVIAALANGEIVVLFCVAPTIADTRIATRRASAWLHQLPAFSHLRLCRSATHGMGTVAAHRECVVGVDVECVSAERAFEDMAMTMLHPAEIEHVTALTDPREVNDTLSHVWVRKEAILKSFGVGLALSPTMIATGSYNEDWQTVTHGVLGTALVRSLKAPDGFACAVALLGAKPASIRGFEFGTLTV